MTGPRLFPQGEHLDKRKCSTHLLLSESTRMTELKRDIRASYTYPAGVHLQRRLWIEPAQPAELSEAGVKTWLLQGAHYEQDLLDLFAAFMGRLVTAGHPVHRATLHIGTLHPQLFAYGWMWNGLEGYCDEFKVEEAALTTDSYRKNPIYRVIEHGEEIRQFLPSVPEECLSPLLKELRTEGYTEYAALPMQTGGNLHHTVTLATCHADGFSEHQYATLRDLLDVFALHVGRHAIKRIAQNVMATYLGEAAGEKVLAGNIKRGSGEPIEAIVWASDMRGSTDLSDKLANDEMLAVLNRYFECLAGAVIDHGGEVLKYIGDGLLAVFPFNSDTTEHEAAQAAVAAATDALARLDKLNSDPAELSGISGWRPLRTGIALHRGEVFFGNVGAPQRLDFTVTGQAVNVASRVEGLTKTLGHPLLITEPVARSLPHMLTPLGTQEVKGVRAPLALYTTPSQA